MLDSNLGDLQNVVDVFDIALHFRTITILWSGDLSFGQKPGQSPHHSGCCGCHDIMQLITISTMNFQTFSELAFIFTLTLDIICKGMGFALTMGLVGGVLPAIRASRMMIVDALRSA